MMDKDEGDSTCDGINENSLLYEGEDDGRDNDGGGDEQENGDGEEKSVSKNGDEQEKEQSKLDEEEFKIELGGLPKYYPLSQLKKLLNIALQLEANRVKPGGMGRNVAYLTFRDEASRFKAITILNGYKWQGSTLSAKEADPTKDPMLLAKIDFLKVPKKEFEGLPLKDRIQKAVTPYHDMSYEDQIKEKDKVAKSFLRKFGNELAQLNPELKKFVHWHKIRRKGQICEVDDFVESPARLAYSNKCELTIGKNKDSDKPVIGYRVASYKEGSIEVGPVDHLTHLNDKMKEVVTYMVSYLETSEHPIYDPFSHDGVWRQLTVRTSRNFDVMIIIQIHPQNLSGDEINELKDDIKKYFTEGAGGAVGITSIYFQRNRQRDVGKEAEYEHAYGKTYIEETIMGKTFRASPESFLQVNTAACEVLYEKIAEVADIDSTSIVLDVCCGVGTIGLSIAEASYKTMGVENIETSIDDARKNAEDNGIANAVFYSGKAEDHIETMIERSQRNNVVAIVDPPKAGLAGGVMNALRKCEYLNKIVYISSDPQAALPNFQALGRPRSKSYKGFYFVPIRATPVDLFPDTPNYQLIIVFERYDECKWDRIMSGNPRPKDQAYFDRIPELSQETKDYHKELEDKRKKESWDDRKRRNKKGGRDDGGRQFGGDGGRRGFGRDWGGYEEEDWDNYRGRRGGGGGYGGGGRGWSSGGNLGAWNTGGPSLLSGRLGGGGRGSGSGPAGGGRRGRGRGGGGGPNEYGEGFQKGFQAGLEVLGNQFSGNQFSGFGQGGGWNMAQTQEDFAADDDLEEEEDFSSMSMNMNESQGPCGWDYTGNKANNNNLGGNMSGMGTGQMRGGIQGSSGSFPHNLSNQPVTYPTSVTNPQQGGQGFGGWNQGGNWGGGENYGWVQSGSGGRGGRGGGNFQNFGEPSAKKWKPSQQQQGNFNAGMNFDYSSY